MAAAGIEDTITLGLGEIQGSSHLLIIEGESSRILYLPGDGEVVVGRDAGVDIQLASSAVSRRHARFLIREEQVEVTDLDSHNGTRVNGEPLVAPRALGSGDVVAIGEATLVLYSHARAPAAGRTVLEMPELGRRLAAEVERATQYERPVALAALFVDGGGRQDVLSVLDKLRSLDIVGGDAAETWLVVMPELRGDEAEAATALLVSALARRGATARGGVAACPDDGCDGDTLLGAARAAASSAERGKVARAAAGTTLILGERRIVVADPAMVRLYELIRRLARSPMPVLISGETGAGKENAAFALHHGSARAAGPFVAINCAALPESLAESELFGHEKGAFSGATAAKEGLLEAAGGGTVFLDEVGELPLAIQAKLLRALEEKSINRLGGVRERKIDVRIVAATNRQLEADVKAGAFRQDLFFRLAAATVMLPPLRDRRREIALLARTFLADACERAGRPQPELSAAVMARLAAWSWPGNVRELKNAMEYVAATATEDVVEPWHLPAPIVDTPAAAADPRNTPASDDKDESPSAPHPFRPIADELRALERRRMEEALHASGGNQTRAAEMLSMPLRTFVLKIKQYGVVARPR